MAEIRKQFKNISGLNVGSKIVVTDKETGEKSIVTHVSFNVDDPPGEFNDILLAMSNDIGIDVVISSAQAKLEGI